MLMLLNRIPGSNLNEYPSPMYEKCYVGDEICYLLGGNMVSTSSFAYVVLCCICMESLANSLSPSAVYT